jgi:hypothetical protein
MIDKLSKFWKSIFNSELDTEKGLSNHFLLDPVFIPDDLVKQTQNSLRKFNDDNQNREGLVYWAGKRIGSGGIVTTVIIPNSEATSGSVQTTAFENAKIIKQINDLDLVLLGQAHSHPFGAGNTHSPGDNLSTFYPFEGHISLVVPDYAKSISKFFRSWGLHRFSNENFIKINPDDFGEHLIRLENQLIDRKWSQHYD